MYQTKPNLPNQTIQTKPNRTEPTKPNQTLAYQACWTKPTKPKLLVKAVNPWVRSAFGNVSFGHTLNIVQGVGSQLEWVFDYLYILIQSFGQP